MRRNTEENIQPKVSLLKVVLTLCLSASLVIGTLPCEPFVVRAAASKEINGLGAQDIMNPLPGAGGWHGNYVYFGTYKGKPVKYRVLYSNGILSVANSTMLLDCDYVLDSIKFSENNTNEWDDDLNTTIYKWMYGATTGFYTEAFNGPEQRALWPFSTDNDNKETGIRLENFGPDGSSCYRKIFPLISDQVTCNKYGYTNDLGTSDSRKKTDIDGNPASWWLRSYSTVSQDIVAVVSENGAVVPANVAEIHGVSPAICLDVDNILFSTKLSTNDSTNVDDEQEYKLTIVDEGLSVTPGVSVMKVNGNNDTIITIPFTVSDNSSYSDPTQVSVVVAWNCKWDERGGWRVEKYGQQAFYSQYAKLEDVSSPPIQIQWC